MEIVDYIIADDKKLVDLALGGDDIAFEYLFNRYSEAIRRLLLHRSASIEDTEDLLQETFIKVYINLQRYSDNYTFGQWIYTIARNTFIDHVRRRRDEMSIDQIGGSVSSAPLFDESPDERIISEQHNLQMAKCMASLPEKYRQMAEMRFEREMSYEEIARQMNLPIGTVKTQIHRARERLCKLIIENDK
jgi:RNA polymerase sigma-70 factor (ECF subfamily)